MSPPDDSTQEHGATTQDLRQRALTVKADLSAAEQRLRTRGTWMLITGAAITGLTLFVGIVWHVGIGDHMPGEILMPMYAAGFGALLLGSLEFLNRPARHNGEKTLAKLDLIEARQKKVETGQRLLVDLLPEHLQQRYHQGQASALRDFFGERTGTDGGSAEVLQMHRRADRQG